jgi:2-amino-4-hydroxy-6-hydroxymethyldihydropteridine diphosphokinase
MAAAQVPAPPTLPAWAIVSEGRRQHIARVTGLLDTWARAIGLSAEEAAAWHDAGRWHDALRDADEATLREMTNEHDTPYALLHGPAAAARLEAEGESRRDVLDAIRWHTTGHANWSRTGRALYMADFLEPGRRFDRAARAALAAKVPEAFDDAFREVVRDRLIWSLREGRAIRPETVALWNAVR